jgi:lipoprotein signal peptidase
MKYIKQIGNHNPRRPILVVLGLVFFDQALKYMASQKFVIMDINKNFNALFGFPFNIIHSIVLFSLIAIFFMFNRSKLITANSPLTLISLGLLFGGIISNLIDRLTKGYILDYLTVFDAFSFNLADLGIYSGVFLLLWKIIKK